LRTKCKGFRASENTTVNQSAFCLRLWVRLVCRTVRKRRVAEAPCWEKRLTKSDRGHASSHGWG
jgi:hypothetical protein